MSCPVSRGLDWYQPRACGTSNKNETLAAPADSPKMVTQFGSPPKYLTYFCVHLNASSMSNMPALPGTSSMSRDRKPDNKVENRWNSWNHLIIGLESNRHTQSTETVLHFDDDDIIVHPFVSRIKVVGARGKTATVNPEHDREEVVVTSVRIAGIARQFRRVHVDDQTVFTASRLWTSGILNPSI